MSQKKFDAKTVAGFLAGEKADYEQAIHYIQTAFRSWQGKFGYETDDILSDVQYKLLLLLRNDRFEYRSNLKTFIKQIVDHTCIDYLRYRQRVNIDSTEPDTLLSQDRSPEEELEDKESIRLSFRVIRLLSKECRQLWRMHLQQGLKYRQIGEILDLTEGNVRRKLWSCREKARKIRKKISKNDKRI